MTMRFVLAVSFVKINQVTNLANRLRVFELIQTLAQPIRSKSVI